MTEIETQVGQKTSIVLPDSSLVFINASSEIGYNEKKWNKKREVKLEGEAFFDVAKGARFDVITPQGKVSVLGTEFNVKQRGNFFEVKCFEGTVRVTASSHHVILKEGDNFRIFQEIVTTGKNTYSVAQWTKNISDFQRVEVSEVFAEIERQYGVQVILENVDANQLFTGGFVHDNVNNALKSITEPLDLEYAILPNDNVRVQPREK